MNLKDEVEKKILEVAEDKKRFRTPDVIKTLRHRVSRQYVSLIISEMVERGKLARQGGGRSTVYALPGYAELLTSAVKRHLKNTELDEDLILTDIQKRASFLSSLKENVYRLFRYAFLEMLNNAIEHSESVDIDVEIYRSDDNLIFTIQDYGIGVYKNVMRKRGLGSELDAMQDILKGKTTTLPEGHSGEGIFFTSKVSDVFILESFGLRLRVDNLIRDIFYEDIESPKPGTKVTFVISAESEKSPEDIFVQYQTDPAEGGFDKTEIRVKLYAGGSVYVSRSQARRILDGLAGKFKTIIFDYDKVTAIGQAFADEIYRVFQQRHLDIAIKSINTGRAVQYMIDRAIATAGESKKRL